MHLSETHVSQYFFLKIVVEVDSVEIVEDVRN